MLLRASIIAVIVAIPSAARADDVTLTINTHPRGATVFMGPTQQEYGYAPASLKYSLGKHFFRDGRCENTQQITVRWASGAQAYIPSLALCGGNGKKQEFTFVRPPEAPGGDIDATFALELQRLEIDRRRASASARRESFQRLADYYRREAERLYAQRPLVCTSNVIGSSVYTTCQ